MIEVQAIAKSFGAVTAVEEVSFTAADGCITGLLGPNGAGKSTTLRILSTVLRPDAGHASIDGLNVATHPNEVRRRIGVLPHNAGLYPNLTGRENIQYYAELRLGADDDIDAAVAATVATLDLDKFVDRPAKGYSQGERTRVALARALVHEPGTLLLDEPTNGMDVMATRALREVIEAYRDRGGCVLFSSHVMQEVASLCEQIVTVANGKVAVRGSTQAIRDQTGQDDLEDAFVAAITRNQEAAL